MDRCRRRTQADFDHAVEIARVAKQEYRALLEDNNEITEIQSFMGLSPEERVKGVDLLLWASGFSIIAWKALKEITHELRIREEDIPIRLMYWYIDERLGKMEPPRRGPKTFKRDAAIVKTVRALEHEGWVATQNPKKRKREEKQMKKRNEAGPYYSLTAAGVTAQVFTVSEATVAKAIERSKQPGTRLYQRFLYEN